MFLLDFVSVTKSSIAMYQKIKTLYSYSYIMMTFYNAIHIDLVGLTAYSPAIQYSSATEEEGQSLPVVVHARWRGLRSE